jgi:hypothetical protein
MKENKSLVQEALIQMKQVEEAIAENAKGILASTMKKEINQLVKESLSEQEEEDEIDLDTDANADVDNDDIDMDSDVEDIDSDEEDMDYDEEDMDSDEEDMDMDMDSDESPIDLTDASDEEILKVFKAMGEDDGIIVKKDGENVYLSDDDANVEYLVKLGESYKDKKNNYSMRDEQDESVDDVINAIFSDSGDVSDVDSDDLDGEETLYEIEMDEPEKVETIYELELDDDNLIPIDEQDDDDNLIPIDEEDDENGFDQYNMDEEDEEDGFDQYNMDEQDDEDLFVKKYGDGIPMDEQDDEDGFDQYNMDEEDDNNGYYNETYKPKGVGIGLGPKFSYKNKTNGGFNEKRKQGPKSVGTGKPKFEYKKGENMGAKSKIVKAETKEGQGYKDKEDEKLSMKHGKIASKDIKTTKGRRDDAGFEKTETKEAARTYGMGSKEGRGLRKGITNNRNYVYSNSGVKTESTQEEVRMLRGKNEEYRKALNVFREKLNEVAIFNSNLAYATRLFTEHSTTKKEKINILRRFDDVETLKESKNLYRSLKDELTSTDTKSINESVTTKLNKSVSTGSSTTLIESKTYENPQFLRMKDLMGKLG